MNNGNTNARIRWFSLIRIVGLGMVLIYHFFHSALPGGFLGVDVFFTFSGYLITALIAEEFARTGNFKLFAYVKRRFLRIFPPLLLSVIFTLPFALLIARDFTGGIGRQVAGALGFVTNYAEILSGGSYEAQLLPHLYIHTWSLALEMHYYLLWGLLCFALVFFVWAVIGSEKRRRTVLKSGFVVLALGLAALCYWQMQALYTQAAAVGSDAIDPSKAYFSSTSHAFPFFIGSAAGALFGMRLPEGVAEKCKGRVAGIVSIVVMVLSIGGLAALGLSMSFNGQATYRWGFLAASLLTVLLICGARALHEATPEQLREPKAISMLADLSYSVYLFHWPLYIIFSERLEGHNGLASLLTFALSLLFAAIVYYGIEPLLHGKRPWQKNKLVMLFYPAVAVLAIAALAGSVLVYTRAPAVTALEQGILNGELYQAADRVAAEQRQVAAVQPAPVAQNRVLVFSYADAPNGNIPEDPWMPAVALPSISGGVRFLGDSVTLGGRKLLDDTIPDSTVDCAVSRSLSQGRSLLKEWAAQGVLEEYVVVSLGTNGYGAWQAQIDGMVEELPAGHRLIFVTPFLGKPQKGIFAAEIAEYYRQLAQQYPFVTVADWAAAIAQKQELLAADKIHFGNVRKCGQLMADTVMLAIAQAGEKPAKE